MGRTTFEPAIGAPRWPWPDLDVFVLGSHRPEGTPDEVVVDSDPDALLEQIRAANRGGDVHLVRRTEDDRDLPVPRRAQPAGPARGADPPGRRDAG